MSAATAALSQSRTLLPAFAPATTTYVVVGLAAAIGLASLGDSEGSSAWLSMFPLAGALGIGIGVFRRNRGSRAAWLAIATGLLLFSLGSVGSSVGASGDGAFSSVANLAYGAGYLPLFAGVLHLVRGSRAGDRFLYVDGAIIGIASGMLLWSLLIDPAGQMHLLPEAVQAVILADTALMALLLPLPMIRESRSLSGVLLVVGFALLAVGDARYGLQLYGAASPDVPIVVDWLGSVGWLGGFVLIGAAALHPSAHRLGTRGDTARADHDVVRGIAVSVAILVLPMGFLLQAVGRPLFNPLLVGTASLALTLLVIYRFRTAISELLNAELRFRRFMNGGGMVVALKDHDGRYRYMNERAIELGGLRGVEWIGRTDHELFPSDVADHHRVSDEAAATGGMYVSTADFAGRTWHSEKFRIPGNGGSVGLLQIDITDRVRAEAALRRRESLLARAEATAHIGSWESDIETGSTQVSDEFCRILGLEPGTAVNRSTWHEHIHPDDRPILGRAYAALERDGVVESDLRIIRPNGEVRFVHTVVVIEAAAGGRRYVGVIEDVTDRREMDERIRMLDAAIGEARDGVVITDREQRIVYVNPAFEQISGVSASEVLGKPPRERTGKTRSTFARALAHVVRHGRSWMGDVIDRRPDGITTTSATTISPLHGADGSVIGHLAIKRDVTRKRDEERASERRARERALIAETLASLRAGRLPEETAAEICGQVAKVPEIAMVTLVAFGEDGFATAIGQSNRQGTHQSGLRLSRQRSDYLRERAAVGPWVERWVDVPGHPYGAMIRELEIAAHAYAPLRLDGEPLGILIAGSDAPDASATLAERLPALLEFAAITGTLLVEPLEARRAAARSERVIREAIERHAFTTVFQPIVELRSGSIRGFEALTRFDDGRPPDAWFAEAQALGVGAELEAACLRSALSASLALPDDAWLNVNVSPEMVMCGRLHALLPRITRQLVLEITEHAAITDYAAFRGAVMLLDERVRIAVDDAGAGFASLRHIVELGPWLVKLDRSLVAGIDADPARQAVVAGMVHFAETAGLVLVGEGIETTAELETLRSLGIGLGQGFLLGRPESVAGAAAGREAGPALEIAVAGASAA